MTAGGPSQDHLFISYAWEDEALARWLALRLTAEGYRVWWDQIKLLGGEPYPRNIDEAIKARTFRMLALLSRNSIHKPNPTKERTLALNIARARKVDFLIPLNVDGIRPDELDWMTSDLSYIPFYHGWADGLRQLLKKLDAIDCPRDVEAGRACVTSYFLSQEQVLDEPETLWTNLLEVCELPTRLLRVIPARGPSFPPDWVVEEQDGYLWAFDYHPWISPNTVVNVDELDWQATRFADRTDLLDIATSLIRLHLLRHCTRRGLIVLDRNSAYFPNGLVPRNRLTFESYGGRRTWVQVAGVRNFRSGTKREPTWYHIAPVLRPALRKYEQPVIQVDVRLHLTDQAGIPLPTRKAFTRGRRIRRNWWNYQWLSRLLAAIAWLMDGHDGLVFDFGDASRLMISPRPTRVIAPVGYDDSMLGETSDEAEELADEEDDVSDEDEDDADP